LKYLVISDIHANLEALDAVLAAAGRYDHALVLGDLVGYGADPNAVIDRVLSLPAATFIRGNHDKAASGVSDIEEFNPVARSAVEWTRRQLRPENLRYLAELPAGPLQVNGMTLVHGALTFHVGDAGLQAHNVLVTQLQFRRIFDRDDAFPGGDVRGKGVEQRRLAGAAPARDDYVQAAANAGP